MKRMILTLAVAAGVLCGFQRAQATILPPDGMPQSPIAAGTATGIIEADTGYVGYTLRDSHGVNVGTGTVREVVATDVTNPHGGLDFIYQVTLATGRDVAHLTVSDFSNWIVDAFQTPVQLAAPNPFFAGITAASSAANSFGNVSFNFQPAITSNPTTSPSYVLIIKTDAPSFKRGNIALQDGGNANVDGFAPSPEPASLVLLGSCFAGLCGVGLMRRRQHKSMPATAV
jgi:hypothetical protein